MKTLVQCDFDGTITEEDISFMLLDGFAQGDWQHLLQDYKEHKISVGHFNTQAFAMVKADRLTLLEAAKDKLKIRAGFHELVTYCSRKGFRLVIVSNGLEFYIKEVLRELGLGKLEVHAAQTQFCADGLKVQYIGTDGKQLDDGLKEACIKSFLKEGYRVIYIGDGDSDIRPARYAHQIFATGELLAYCKEHNLKCKPFNSLNDVVEALKLL